MTDSYLPKLSDRQRRWARFLAMLAALALLVWAAMVLRQVLTPLVAALALGYILNPPVTLLEENYKVKRVTSVSVGLCLLLLAGAALLFAGTAQLVQLAGNIPSYASDTFEWLDETIPGLFTGAEEDAPSETPGVGDTSRERLTRLASEHGLSVGRSVIGYIADVLSNVFYWLSLTVLLPLYTFFFLLHFNEIVRAARDHLPADYRPTIVRVVTTIDAAISSFFRGRLVICLIVGTLTGVGWLIVGVPYSLPLGALLAMLNLVPFMSVLALPPALILTYFDASNSGDNWVIAVTLAFGVYAVAQAIESFVLTPTIQAKASGLHPVTTVIVLLIGGQLAGLLGMLLAIPITSTLKSLGAEYLLPEVRQLAHVDVGKPPGAPPAETEPTQASAAAEPMNPTDGTPEDKA